MRPLLVLALLALPVVAAPVPKAVKKNNSLDGHWYLVEVIHEGKSNTKLDTFHRHSLVQGERYSCAKAGRPDGSDSTNWTIRDPQRPHLRMWGTFPAVIEVDGDTLRAALSLDPKVDVTECKPGNGVAYYVYARVKE